MALVGILSTQLLHQQFVEGVKLRVGEQIRVDRIVTRSSTIRPESSHNLRQLAVMS